MRVRPTQEETYRLYQHSHGCNCGCHDTAQTQGIFLQLLNGDKDLIAQIYSEGANGVNDVLLQRYAGGFDKAVRQVFQKKSELSDKLRINASKFGTYKTYDLCCELEKARQAGLTLDEFQKFAGGRIGVYNAFQKTEYNTLVARARTAKQFTQFEKDANLYPNLEWLASRSATPRIEHLGYVGLVLSIDDPFWNHNQPGNEYNCKCDWRQTNKPTAGKPKNITPPAKGLEGNPAKTGELITNRHPYFGRNANAPKWVENKALLQLPDDVAFIKTTMAGGKTYSEHRLANEMAETTNNRKFATLLLINGYNEVKLLPQINKTEKALRTRYFGKEYTKKYPTTNPDASVDGNLIEFKKSNRKRLSQHILEASKQSDMVAIRLKEAVTEQYINRFIKGQWNMHDRKDLKEIILYINDELCVFKRP